MAIHPCPCCHGATPRWLEGCSTLDVVDYYRCEFCAHVWTVARDGSRELRHITPPGRGDPPEEGAPLRHLVSLRH